MRVLILGGTGESRALARRLQEEYEVVSSLAGRLADPVLPDGRVRIGGFGGAEGLTAWLREQRIGAVLDATHPFAQGITTNAVAAARAARTPLLVVHRPPWLPGREDTWEAADSMDDACARAARFGQPVFLTIGRQEMRSFTALRSVVARVIDPPGWDLPGGWHLITQRGPFRASDERSLMEHFRIGVLVTKNSGGEQTYAKLAAARELGIPVVMVRRPALPLGTAAVSSTRAAVRWVKAVSRELC
ncbi:cobalt-precorrin-6A reductase [Hoyosella subflava]|uniref:Precorrin-6x reductase CbiJ/CobK n=1 Tax=Hoyosella subflava (strain DSM 45089 / JCM 17490 / NBRC 109087 / DQS3-9A1) TaxID=443218 RepID=F6EP11_HOYSD|nr:cobalt-precorrin-6A reductase [Hoyosella subflava]AEF40477.1 Precorrin-6x reductase CbiJ/CobK [Hoyosella subflava DQS3-9A1]